MPREEPDRIWKRQQLREERAPYPTDKEDRDERKKYGSFRSGRSRRRSSGIGKRSNAVRSKAAAWTLAEGKHYRSDLSLIFNP
jgi:hypothetical protein